MSEEIQTPTVPRIWLAYTAAAALLGAFLLYNHFDHSQAQKHFDTGASYLRLITEPEAKERAMHHLRTAAEQGHTDAQRVLGTIHLEDFEKEKEPADAEAARHWLEMAATAGDADAAASLERLPPDQNDDLPGG